ncbi:hypothetical protein T03_6821 [Trichinella britovi]|uniref:Uncharacterized protein n=1 Tax=Trichinella britovi TaxID=45882 RepID=A0A0V1CRC0_TRIBR|nr:hypothetical protein T03_6821 [Trichinella britovi]
MDGVNVIYRDNIGCPFGKSSADIDICQHKRHRLQAKLRLCASIWLSLMLKWMKSKTNTTPNERMRCTQKDVGDENDDGLDEDKLNCSMHYKKRKDDCRTTVIGGSGREQNMKKM